MKYDAHHQGLDRLAACYKVLQKLCAILFPPGVVVCPHVVVPLLQNTKQVLLLELPVVIISDVCDPVLLQLNL